MDNHTNTLTHTHKPDTHAYTPRYITRHTHTHICTYARSHTYTHTQTYTHTHTHTRTHTHTHTHLHTHSHTHTHTHIYTHTHTHTACSCSTFKLTLFNLPSRARVREVNRILGTPARSSTVCGMDSWQG